MEAKLYSPVFCDLWENEYGNYNGDPEIVNQWAAAQYRDEIHSAILKERLPEEAERGLMAYYYESDPVDEKVQSMCIDVDVHGGQLWAVATLELTEPLTPEELNTLREYITGQYADGFGEGFEQRRVAVEDGELNIHLWTNGDEFFIDTQEQFARRLGIALPADAILYDTANAWAAAFAGPVSGPVSDGAAQLIEERLFSPLQFYLHDPREEQENGEYGEFDLYDERYQIPGSAAYEYMDAIELTVMRDRDRLDQIRGMAEYLPGELQGKIRSVFPSVEICDGELYCVTKMELTSALTPEETASLKGWWSGQLSDGWGEGFEQRAIKIGHEELYITPWTSDYNVFFIDTQVEFDRRQRNEMSVAIPDAEREQPPVVQSQPSESAQAALPDPIGTGYVFAVADDSNYYVPNALHVERDDGMMTFQTDVEAAEAAKRDGVPLIDDIAGVPDRVYIDTPENRALIEQWLELRANETPAQAALHEPDAFEDERTAFLRDQLIERLNENFASYFNDKRYLNSDEIAGQSFDIAATSVAYAYLTEVFNFHASELEYLLKFQNPLKVVSAEFENVVLENRSDSMWKIFHEQSALKKNYALVTDESAKDKPEHTAVNDSPSGYTSVLDRIRQDKKEKHNPPPAKDKAKDKDWHKNSDGEL